MPTYSFRNTKTDEVVEKIMKMSEREPWLEANPDWQQVHLEPLKIGDTVRLGLLKPPSDFQKHIIGKVAEMPGSTIKQNSKFGIPKEY